MQVAKGVKLNAVHVSVVRRVMYGVESSTDTTVIVPMRYWDALGACCRF